MANMPAESYLIPTSVPQRASGTATVPLAQNVTVGPMPSPSQVQPATPLRPVKDPGRQRPSTVSGQSGRDSGYPAGTNMPAPVPGGMPTRGR
jgi:hypothetical protein